MKKKKKKKSEMESNEIEKKFQQNSVFIKHPSARKRARRIHSVRERKRLRNNKRNIQQMERFSARANE